MNTGNTENPKDLEDQAGEYIKRVKAVRVQLDGCVQSIKALRTPGGTMPSTCARELALSFTKTQEAIMWLGMALREIGERFPSKVSNPYPESRNPESTVIHPTADGLKM